MKSARLWIGALASALAMHGAAAGAAFMLLTTSDGDLDYGADVVEISLETTPPRADAQDLPPGPAADESAASAAAAPQEAQAAETPKIVETPSEDADLRQSRPAPQEARREAPPDASSAAASASVASEAAAPPPIDNAVEAPRAAAPQIGDSLAAARARALWVKKLVAHLERNKRFPAGVRLSGETKIAFALDAQGHVLSASVVASSGEAALDAAALAMMKRADPVPSPPPALAAAALTFELPVVFRQGRAH